MNDIIDPVLHADNASDVRWPNGDHRARVADTSMLPGSEKAPAAAAGLLKNAVRGAHDTLDRLADSAAPVVQKLGRTVSTAGQTLHAKGDQLREKRDEWAEGARSTVRSKPLVSVAAALALGAAFALIASIARNSRNSRNFR